MVCAGPKKWNGEQNANQPHALTQNPGKYIFNGVSPPPTLSGMCMFILFLLLLQQPYENAVFFMLFMGNCVTFNWFLIPSGSRTVSGELRASYVLYSVHTLSA